MYKTVLTTVAIFFLVGLLRLEYDNFMDAYGRSEYAMGDNFRAQVEAQKTGAPVPEVDTSLRVNWTHGWETLFLWSSAGFFVGAIIFRIALATRESDSKNNSILT